MTRFRWLFVLACITWSGCVPDPGRRATHTESRDVYQQLLDAEDARPADGDVLTLLLDAATSEDPYLRRIAVRALGRLEDPELAATIVPHLEDVNAAVRATAATALAQSVHGEDGSWVLDHLIARVESESDASARGALARSLGRLRLATSDRRRAVEALATLGGAGGGEPEEALVGLALGLESVMRLSDDEGLSRPAADVLAELITLDSNATPAPGGDAAGHIRALAASALGRSRRLTYELIDRALSDPEPEVRRVVVDYLGVVSPTRRGGLLTRALEDTSPRVRIAAVRYLARLPRTAPRCEQLITAAGPAVPAAVRVVALEALGRGCPNFSAQRARLVSTAAELGDTAGGWQPAARALLSLAAIDRDAAARALPAFAQHRSTFVRAWAARAAREIRDVDTLELLSADRSPNVRADALQGLFSIVAHAIDELLLAELQDDDPQLLLTVAALLEEAPGSERVAPELLSAFERVSAVERETWRDPRMALLERIEEHGDASMAGRLLPFLSDYDSVVAGRVGALLELWSGREQVVTPEPLPRASVPTLEELRTLDGATLSLHMADGGTLVVELLADEAPTNVARVVRLAEADYYDGLTFHRWAANFVIQGGSPAANEYQGDGPYTRDEVGGVPHWRGTVGISTRGRDTGDGQLFINLVDNPRLNHEYTVIGRLIDGYDLLDGILEGAVIERAEITKPQ